MKYQIWSRTYWNADVCYDDDRAGVEVAVTQETRRPVGYPEALRWLENARGADHEWEPRLGLAEYWLVPA